MTSPLYAFADIQLSRSTMDGKVLRCRAGNKQCGNRCVPQKAKCAEEGGGSDNDFSYKPSSGFLDMMGGEDYVKELQSANGFSRKKAISYIGEIESSYISSMNRGTDPNQDLPRINKKYFG